MELTIIGGHDGNGDARCKEHIDSERICLPVYSTMKLDCTYCGQDWREPVEEVHECHCGGLVVPSTDKQQDLSPYDWYCESCYLVYICPVGWEPEGIQS